MRERERKGDGRFHLCAVDVCGLESAHFFDIVIRPHELSSVYINGDSEKVLDVQRCTDEVSLIPETS
jgi:hypothetical protein